MYATVTGRLERNKIKCKYANRKPIYDFLYDGKDIICPIWHYLRYIQSRNEHGIDLTFRMGQDQM